MLVLMGPASDVMIPSSLRAPAGACHKSHITSGAATRRASPKASWRTRNSPDAGSLRWSRSSIAPPTMPVTGGATSRSQDASSPTQQLRSISCRIKGSQRQKAGGGQTPSSGSLTGAGSASASPSTAGTAPGAVSSPGSAGILGSTLAAPPPASSSTTSGATKGPAGLSVGRDSAPDSGPRQSSSPRSSSKSKKGKGQGTAGARDSSSSQGSPALSPAGIPNQTAAQAAAAAAAAVLGAGAAATAMASRPLVAELPESIPVTFLPGDDGDLDELLESVSGSDSEAELAEPDDLDVYRGLVLDCSYRPINVVCWKRALCLEIADKVDVLEYYDAVVRSPNQTFPIPAVLRVSNFVHAPKQSKRKLSLSRNNIFLRDKFRCQYCGSKDNLTIDHVKALSRGGGSSWENLVAACSPCNLRKGDKSPAEANMKLARPPREPKELDTHDLPPNYRTFRSLARHRSTPPQWLDWLPLQPLQPFQS